MRKQSERTIAQLIAQYPDLASLNQFLEFFLKRTPPSPSGILVQRADTSLMFRQANNVDGERQFVCGENGRDGKRQEYAFAVPYEGSEPEVLVWLPQSPKVLKDIFTDITPAKVKYLVWVTIYDWYVTATDEQRGQGQNLGEYQETQLFYTIYLPPKKGDYEHLIETADVLHNVELTEQALIYGILRKIPGYEEASELLGRKAKEFEERVYLNGLKAVVDTSKKKGMSGIFNGVKVLSWVMCGRVMITLSAPTPGIKGSEDSVTFICNEDGDPHMSHRSVFATLDRANELTELVMTAWESTPQEQHAKYYCDDEQVKLAGM